MKITLFGPRVLLEKEKPAHKGALLLPDSPTQIHSLARVRVVGDGKLPDGKIEKLIVAENDIILFQTNAMIAAACSYELGGNTFITLFQSDLIARMRDTYVQLEGMEMLSRWVLVEPYIRQTGKIIIPETLNYQEHLEHTYWRFVKAAPGSELPVKAEQEVILDANRANPLQIGTKVYCYIDERFILGTCEETHEALAALAD